MRHAVVVMARITVFLLALLGSCSAESGSPTLAEPSPASAPAEPAPASAPSASATPASHEYEYELDEASAATLREAVRDYLAWGRVDERPNVAPVLCRAPLPRDYGAASQVRLSRGDAAEHGRKLYFLFAGPLELGGRNRYTELGKPGGASELPIGFTVVKQSWTAEPGPAPAPASPTNQPNAILTIDPPPPVTTLEHEGRQLHTGEPRELFVMTKIGAPDTPGTDRGWIYGTLTPDGQTATSAGRVERCMSCHEHADHERLFGLQPF
jgi:hypothetical protein